MKPKHHLARLRGNSVLIATSLVVCLSNGAMAQTDNNWTGSVSGEWNNAANWSAGAVPSKGANQHAVINTNSPNIASITLGIIPPVDIMVGTTAAATLNHPSGDAATGATNYMFVGRNAGGNGTYNLTSTTPAVGNLTGFEQGSGNMTVSGGRLYVGGFAGAATGLCNVNTTGVLAVGNDLAIGTAGGTGVMNIDSGTVNTSGWNFFGKNEGGTGGKGTLNMAGGTFFNTGRQYVGTPTCEGWFNLTGGSYTCNGNLLAGGTTDDGDFLGTNGTGTGHIVVSGSGTSLTVGGEFTLGNRGGTADMTFSGGTIESKGWTQVGRNGGHGTLTMTGGIWNKTNGGDFVVGDFNNATGTFSMSGGTLTNNNTFRVSSGGTGVVNVSGSAAITTNNELWVGQAGNGTLNLSGGSLTVGNWIAVGRGGGTGTVTMTGGSWSKNASDSNFIIGSSGTGTFTMSGGTVSVADSGAIDRGVTWIGETNNCTGTLSLSGGAQFTTERFVLGVNGGTTGNLNLNGGAITTGHILGGNGTANVSFNGTQINVSASSTDFIQNLDSAVIAAGGLLIDDLGNSLTAAQVFTGSGGLVKSGAGTLTLSGANSYAGSTSVTGGKLVLSTESGATGAISLADTCRLGLVQSVLDDNYATAGITFGTSDATILDMDLGNFAGNTANAPLNVTGSGALSLNGAVTINIADTMPVVGSIPLVSYTDGKTGTGAFALGTLPDGVVATLDDNGTNLVSLNVTRVNDAYWTGAISTSWDTTTANWNDDYAESASTYADGDPVTFDDRVVDAGPEITVMLFSTVAPGGSGVTFGNATKNYNIWGVGKITGTTKLTKQGAGTTTIDTMNDYTGVTSVNGGTLKVGVLTDGGIASPIGAADSSSSNLVFNGGTLHYTGAATSTDRGFTTTGGNGGILTDSDLTISGAAASTGAGNFSKSGAGNLKFTLDGVNSFGGAGASGLTVLNGPLTFDGTGTSQINSVVNDIWVGTTASAGGSLLLQNTTVATSGNGYLAIARGSGTTGLTSTCTLNNSTLTTGNLSLGYANGVAGYLATSVLTLNDSTYTMSGICRLGESGGANGTVNLNGASIMSSGDTNIAQDSGSVGTLNINDTSAYTSNNRLQVGPAAGSSGNVVISGSGSMTVNAYVSIGYNGGGGMTVKNNAVFSNSDDFSVNENGDVPATVTLQDNGSISSAGVVFVGRGTGRAGTVTQTGGTFTGSGNEFQIGKFGTGTWLQSGGVTNAGGWVSIGRETGGTGVLTVAGTGSFTQTGTDRGLIVGEFGSGTLNVQGTATVTSLGATGVLVSNGGSGVGVVNLDGGTLQAMRIADGGGNGTFNFNGGKLVAGTGSNPAFLGGLDAAYVKSGGANIDTNGESIGIDQALLDGTGNGGLTKTGAGTLLLNGANTYTGTTTVNAGTLGGTGSVAGNLTIAASAALAPGASAGTFTAGATTLAGTYACEIDGTNCDKLVANGSLVISGATLAISQINPASGPALVIATYTGAAPAPFATVTGVPSGYTLDYSYGGNSIALIQTATPFTTWINGFTSIPVGDRDPGDDADGDGVSNIAEFALNANPASGASTGKVVGKVAGVGGNPTLVLTLPVRSGATFSGGTEQVSALIDGVIYRIQGSDELNTWNLAVSEVLGADKTAIESGLPALDSGWSYRSFQSPGGVSGDPADFLRAVIESP